MTVDSDLGMVEKQNDTYSTAGAGKQPEGVKPKF
jgi:hypothetical protein